jgi:hypothetical protein
LSPLALSRERNGLSPTKRLRKSPQHHQVGVKLDAVLGATLISMLRTAAKGPRLGAMLWASRVSFLTVTFAPPLGAAASPAAPGALRG